MTDDELDRLEELAGNGAVEWADVDQMVALAREVDEAPNRWDLLAALDRDERELYGRMVDLLDPPRIDSPESDGEGSWEGPDFDYDDDDTEEGT